MWHGAEYPNIRTKKDYSAAFLHVHLFGSQPFQVKRISSDKLILVICDTFDNTTTAGTSRVCAVTQLINTLQSLLVIKK